jgi:hypothetical protein
MEFSTHALGAARLLIAAAIVALSGGCTAGLWETRVVAPTAPGAKECVATCDLNQQQCEQRQRVREEECSAYFDDLNAALPACLATPGALCVRPDRCLGVDLGICKVQYQECILSCGGAREGTRPTGRTGDAT